MDLARFDAVAAFLDARLKDEIENPTRRYANRTEAFRDIEAKVRVMNRAYEARDLVESFPGDPGLTATLAVYDATLRHLAEVYNTHPDYPRLVARRHIVEAVGRSPRSVARTAAPRLSTLGHKADATVTSPLTVACHDHHHLPAGTAGRSPAPLNSGFRPRIRQR